MFRTTLFALASLVGLSLPAVADAHPFFDGLFGRPRPLPPIHRPIHPGFYPPVVVRPAVVHYRVLYRDCFCQHWTCFGVYCDPCEANLIAQRLRCQGFIVRVVTC